MSDAILTLEGVVKDYGASTGVVTRVLHGIDLVIRRGEMACLIGPSGSGKSTLLNLMGLLDRPSAGEVRVFDRRADRLSDAELTELRGRSLGFIFQFHHLIPALSAAENVMMPLVIGSERGRIRRDLYHRAVEALAWVGLADRATANPRQLSGGQQQRVAIARALVAEPPLILADEPTGNLDTHTADDIFALMQRCNRDLGTALLIVTHDPRLAARCERVIELVDGRVVRDGPNGP